MKKYTKSSKYTEEKTSELSSHVQTLINSLSKNVSTKADYLIDQAYELGVAGHIPMERGASAIQQWAESSNGDFDDSAIKNLINQIGKYADDIFNYYEVTEQILAYQEILSKLNREYVVASGKKAVLFDQTTNSNYIIHPNGSVFLDGAEIPLSELSHLCKLTDSDMEKSVDAVFYTRWIKKAILISSLGTTSNIQFIKKLNRYFDGEIREYTSGDIAVFSNHVLSKQK